MISPKFVTMAVMACAIATGGCATKPTRSAKRGKLPPGAQEDFTLGEARASDETTGHFLSTATDVTPSLQQQIPGIAGSEDPSPPEDVFGGEAPAELASSIAQVIDELAPLHIFVVTADATVRAQPIADAAVVSTMPKGRRLVGIPQGDWICVGKGQYVEAAALMPFVEESTTAEKAP